MTPRIDTERLALVPFEKRHLTARYVGWLNDPATVRYSELRHTRHTPESCARYAAAMAEGGHFFWAIERKADSAHIGNITAYLDRANGTADLAILIGEPDARGAGLGREAWVAACDGLAREPWLRKLCAGTLAANKPMLRAMEAAGMAVEAVRKGHFVVEGHPMDAIYAARFIR